MKAAVTTPQGAPTVNATTQNSTDAIFNGDVVCGVNLGSRALALDTVTAGGVGGSVDVGFTDLISSLALSSVSQDNSAAPGSRAWPTNTAVSNSVLTNGNRRHVAPYNATLATGIQLKYNTAPPAADLQTMMILGGTDHQASAVTALFTGSPNADQDIPHQLGGPPEWIFAIGIRSVAFDLVASGYMFSAGFWTATGSCGMGIQQQNGTVPTNVGAIMRASTDVGSFISNTPAVNNTVTISNVGTTTFRVSTGGGGNNGAICFLCGRGVAAPLNVKNGINTTPTSLTTQAISGMGGPPIALITISSRLQATTLQTDDTAGSWGVGFAVNNNGVTQQYAHAATIKDNVNPSVAFSQVSAKALLVLANDGTRDIEATVQSWDATGVTLNYSNVAANAFEYLYLLIGPPVPIITGNSNITDGLSFTIDGSSFSSAGNSVTINGIAQTVTAQSTTQITCTAVQSGLMYGTNYPLVVTNSTGQSSTAAYVISLQVPAGKNYVILVDPLLPAGSRITTSPDLQAGWQLEWSNITGGFNLTDVIIYPDGEWIATVGNYTFDVRANDGVNGWGTIGTQTISVSSGGGGGGGALSNAAPFMVNANNITTNTVLYTASATNGVVITGFVVANTSGSPAAITVTLTDASAGVTTNIRKSFVIAVNKAEVIATRTKPLVIEASDSISISSTQAVDVTLSGVGVS